MTRKLLATVVLFSSLWSAPVSAKIMVIEIGKDVQRDVPLWPGMTTTLSFVEPVTYAVLGNEIDYWATKSTTRLYALDIKTANPPISNFNLETWSGNAVLRVHAAESPEDAVLHIRFVYPPGDKKSGKEAEVELTPERARAWRHRAVADYALQTTAHLPRHHTGWREGAHALSLRVGHIGQGDKLSVFPFTVKNTGNYPYPITRFELSDHNGNSISASLHTATGDNLGEDSKLKVGAQFRGVFVLEDPAPLDKGWQLQLASTSAIPAASFSSTTSDVPYPGMLELRTAVEVHALGGAGQLSDNLNLNQSAWGTVSGAGVRVFYGPSKHTAIVGGIDFVQTAATNIDTPSGVLETSATGGRFQVGGRLHAGDKIVPYIRAGLGVMMASHSFSMAGMQDSEFRAAFLVGLGGGVEAWIGKRVFVGLDVNSSFPIGDATGQVIEGGLRVGVAFGKLRNHWIIR